MSTLVCPICEVRFEVHHSTAMPFCSERCRHLDFARWMNEDYGLPFESSEETMFAETPDDE